MSYAQQLRTEYKQIQQRIAAAARRHQESKSGGIGDKAEITSPPVANRAGSNEQVRDYLFVSEPVFVDPVTVGRLLEAVGDYFAISRRDLVSHRRYKGLSKPRQIVMWLAEKHTGYSFGRIGEHIGGRDPTTIRHGCGVIKKLVAADVQVRADIIEIERRLGVYDPSTWEAKEIGSRD